MDIERAKAISQVADTIIESAKVECKFIELTGGDGTGFVPPKPKLPGPTNPSLPARITRSGT